MRIDLKAKFFLDICKKSQLTSIYDLRQAIVDDSNKVYPYTMCSPPPIQGRTLHLKVEQTHPIFYMRWMENPDALVSDVVKWIDEFSKIPGFDDILDFIGDQPWDLSRIWLFEMCEYAILNP